MPDNDVPTTYYVLPRVDVMNSPLGRNFPHWGKVEKRGHEFLKFKFSINIVWNIFIYLYETELQ